MAQTIQREPAFLRRKPVETRGTLAQHDPSIHQGRRVSQARAARSAIDIVLPTQIIADGSIHRCDAAGKNGKGDAAYLLQPDGIPAGGLENWRDAKGWQSWRFDILGAR